MYDGGIPICVHTFCAAAIGRAGERICNHGAEIRAVQLEQECQPPSPLVHTALGSMRESPGLAAASNMTACVDSSAHHTKLCDDVFRKVSC